MTCSELLAAGSRSKAAFMSLWMLLSKDIAACLPEAAIAGRAETLTALP
jgi:hypothetical protein